MKFNKNQFETPILFIIFNKPGTTMRVFEAIKSIRPKNLFIAADGPRENNEKDKVNCQKVREIIKEVDWPCNLKTLFQSKNLGCKRGEVTAMNWFFENVEEGIILEDDTLPGKSFFRFCEELLEKYKDDERVMSISGGNFQRGYKRNDYSYYFSKYAYIWGWATWKRAWKKYDIDTKLYPQFKKEGYLKDVYPNYFERLNIKSSLDLVHYNNFDTWDFQWGFAVSINNGLTIVPNENLVQNIGMVAGATHMTSFDKERSFEIKETKFPLHHPQFIIPDRKLDNRYFRWMFSKKIRNFILRKTGLIKLFRT